MRRFFLKRGVCCRGCFLHTSKISKIGYSPSGGQTFCKNLHVASDGLSHSVAVPGFKLQQRRQTPSTRGFIICIVDQHPNLPHEHQLLGERGPSDFVATATLPLPPILPPARCPFGLFVPLSVVSRDGAAVSTTAPVRIARVERRGS